MASKIPFDNGNSVWYSVAMVGRDGKPQIGQPRLSAGDVMSFSQAIYNTGRNEDGKRTQPSQFATMRRGMPRMSRGQLVTYKRLQKESPFKAAQYLRQLHQGAPFDQEA